MENIVDLSPKAQEEVLKIFEKDKPRPEQGLRLSVIGGGCSGLSYKMEITDPKEKDNVLTFGAIRIFIDPKSSIYLKGIVLDFKDGLSGKGFVFDNPNAKNTCGCGESFSI